MSVGGVQIWEAATGGCSERLVGFRLRELWQQALNYPGQGTKRELAWGSRAGARSRGKWAVARVLTLNCRGEAGWLGVELKALIAGVDSLWPIGLQMEYGGLLGSPNPAEISFVVISIN